MPLAVGEIRLDRIITRTIRGESPGRDADNHPLPGVDSTASEWATRRDFTGRDQLGTGLNPNAIVEMTRYYVRLPWPPTTWAVGDSFQDHGTRYEVQGVAEVGVDRGRLIELLVRSTGKARM